MTLMALISNTTATTTMTSEDRFRASANVCPGSTGTVPAAAVRSAVGIESR
jgi:hypothetical protein